MEHMGYFIYPDVTKIYKDSKDENDIAGLVNVDKTERTGQIQHGHGFQFSLFLDVS